MAIVNISPDEAQAVTLATPGPAGTTERLEYHFSGVAVDGLHSHSVLLNGHKLALDGDELPPLTPKSMDAGTPIAVAPESIVFVELPGAKCPG